MAIKLDEARIRFLKTNGTTTIAGGHVYLTGSSAGSSTGNTTQLVFGTSSSNHVVLSANDNALVINPTTSSTTNQIVLYLNQKSQFPSGVDAGAGGITTAGAISATGNISGNYIQGTWLYTSAATAQTTTSKIAIIHSDNYIYYITPANLTTLIKDNASGTWDISISSNAGTATTLANARSLKISSTPGTTGTSFNGSADATLIIPTTVKTFTELGTNKISSTAALYITPASTLYLDSAASTSILFRPQGAEKARFDATGNFLIKTDMYPGTDNSYSLGISTYRWKYIYGGTTYIKTCYIGTASTQGNIYLQASGNSSTLATYGRFYVNAVGTAGDGTTAVSGATYLTLGNSIASSTATNAGLNNAYGVLRIYGTGTTYQALRAVNGSNSRTTYLRDYGATAYIVSTTTTDAVGSSTRPVYVKSNGVVAQCGTSLAVSITGNAATASSVAWSNVTGKPSTFTPSSHTHSYLPLTGGTLTGNLSIQKASWGTFAFKNESGNSLAQIAISNSTNAFDGKLTFRCYSSASSFSAATLDNAGVFTANKVKGAVWNDYAEYRWVLKHPDTDEPIESGRCVAENGNDSMSLTHDRLQAGARIISDTYGMCMGETEKAKTPIAVCGRVLAYPFERKVAFNVGDPVCSGPNGTVSKMSREEAMMYPERIVGTVVSKPTYKEWGPNKIPIKGRIWIQVR